MKSRVRVLAALALILVMTLVLTVSAGAEDHGGIIASGECGNNLTWTLYEDGLLSIDGTGAMWSYSWKEISGIYITTAPWGDYSDSLSELRIGDSVTTIGDWAFYNCSGFTGELVIPDSVTTIGDFAFCGCYSGFKGTLTLGNSVETIGESAFFCCSGFTGSLTIPDSVKTIGDSAFFYCRFTGSLTIGNSVTTIGYEAFYNCNGFTGGLTVPDSVETIGERAFSLCSGFTGNLTIGNSVTTIGYEAFYKCNGFTGNLTIGNSVTTIGSSAFSGCSGFTGDLVIPDSVKTIGDNAFRGCRGFTGSLTIGDSVTTIGDSAFWECSGFTGSLTIPDSVTTIGYGAFYDCSGFRGDLVIPNSVTSIGWSAFCDCSGFTGELVIPDSVTTIEDSAFYGCSGFTGELVIPDSVTSIGWDAFRDCSGFTGELVIPDSVMSIGWSAFSDCSGFTGELVIPDSVTTIEDSAFYGCSGFTGSLTIPDSVMSIGDRAFYSCSGILSAYFYGDVPSYFGDYVFDGCADDFTVYYLEGKTGWTNPWNGYRTEIFNLDDIENQRNFESYMQQLSTIYNNDLALIAATLSMKTYDNDGKNGDSVKGYLQYELGFDEAHHARFFDNNYGGSLAYTVATRDYDGEGADKILVIVCQGSTNLYELLKDVTAGTKSTYQGYKVYDIVQDFYTDIVEKGLPQVCETDKYYKVLVTGHSLGGAAANLVGAAITDYFADNTDVFCYTFGAINSIITDSTVNQGYENIHNVYNVLDTFSPVQYGSYLLTGMGRGYGKFGHMDLFVADYRSESQMSANGIAQITEYVNHGIDKYVDAVESGMVNNSLFRGCEKNEWLNEYFGCSVLACPINVDVFRDGELVGRVINNVVDETVTSIDIFVEGDAKFILYPDNHRYELKITAFDEGTMNYLTLDLSGSEQTKLITGVVLREGKELYSEVGDKIETPDIKLYVVNDTGETLAEVNEDGTEVPIGTFLPGDMDGDGTPATPRDAMVLARYIAGWDGYANQINLDAADLDGDSIPATPRDAMVLARHIAGWTGYETIPLK